MSWKKWAILPLAQQRPRACLPAALNLRGPTDATQRDTQGTSTAGKSYYPSSKGAAAGIPPESTSPGNCCRTEVNNGEDTVMAPPDPFGGPPNLARPESLPQTPSVIRRP